jgi:ferric iron reductase protein FhuF
MSEIEEYNYVYAVCNCGFHTKEDMEALIKNRNNSPCPPPNPFYDTIGYAKTEQLLTHNVKICLERYKNPFAVYCGKCVVFIENKK